MWYNQKFFKISISIILLLLIIYLTLLLRPLFNFVFEFIESLLFPIIIAGVLYYILRPFCEFLARKNVPRLASILIIYFLALLVFGIIINFFWPAVNRQIMEFSSWPTEKIKEVETRTINFMNLFNFTSLTNQELRQNLMYFLQKSFSVISANLSFTISSIAQITSYFIITPFILFYFLKDDHKFRTSVLYKVPPRYENITQKILVDADRTLSSYISGQVMVAFIVGVLIYIGYEAIGLNYAFLLALIAMVFNLIPFCGPFISTIPALIIGLSINPFMGIKVILVVIAVHLLDLNLISPRVVGPRLKIHPITIILLLVASLPLVGFLGLFIIIPLYALIKVIISDLYEMNIISTDIINSK